AYGLLEVALSIPLKGGRPLVLDRWGSETKPTDTPGSTQPHRPPKQQPESADLNIYHAPATGSAVPGSLIATASPSANRTTMWPVRRMTGREGRRVSFTSTRSRTSFYLSNSLFGRTTPCWSLPKPCVNLLVIA